MGSTVSTLLIILGILVGLTIWSIYLERKKKRSRLVRIKQTMRQVNLNNVEDLEILVALQDDQELPVHIVIDFQKPNSEPASVVYTIKPGQPSL